MLVLPINNSSSIAYEPEGREFESLRARYFTRGNANLSWLQAGLFTCGPRSFHSPADG